jgi:hypothetical protein
MPKTCNEQHNGALEKFLTRRELAIRWRCSRETVKRRQRSGDLRAVYLSDRKVLYSLAEIEALEAAGRVE